VRAGFVLDDGGGRGEGRRGEEGGWVTGSASLMNGETQMKSAKKRGGGDLDGWGGRGRALRGNEDKE